MALTANDLRRLAKMSKGEILSEGAGGILGALVPGMATRSVYSNLRQRDRTVGDAIEEIRLRAHGRLKGTIRHSTTMDRFVIKSMRKAKVPDKVIQRYQRKFRKRKAKLKASGKVDLGWAFEPQTKTMIRGLTGRAPSPGVIAHELGHAEQPMMQGKIGPKLYSLGKIAPLLLAWSAASRLKAMSVRKSLLGGLALSSPTLYAEMDASARGSKLLGKYTDEHPASSWIGVPSYMVHASLPATISGGRKLGPKVFRALRKIK